MKRCLILFALAGLAGCARFEARPLAPAQSAAQLQARRLDDADLHAFLTQSLGHAPAVWPLPEWDLGTLSLAAFYFHPSLAVARAQLAVTQAGMITAGGRPNPSVSVTPGYNTTTFLSSPWTPAINFDWPVETAGKRAKRLAGALALTTSARWDVVTAAWAVRSTLRETLVDAKMAERRRALLTEQSQWQEQIVQRLEQRLTAGEVARPELVTAQIALQKLQSDRLEAESRATDARVRLAGAIGLPVEALTGVRINYAAATKLSPELTAATARKVALVARADILGALADYAAAEADLHLEIAKQYPDIHFSPGYQFDQGDNKWSLGLSVELPVINQNQGPIATAQAKRQLVAAQFMALQARVTSEVDRALAGYHLAQSQAAAGEQLLATLQSQLSSTQAQVAAGASDQFELLGAQLDLAAARVAQLDIETQGQRAQGALEDALQHPLDAVTAQAFKQLTAAPPKPSAQP